MQRYWRQFWYGKYRWIARVLFGAIVVAFVARSLPYLMPIRAADIAQTDGAIEFTDRYGLPLGTLLTRDRDRTAVVPLEQISPTFIQAIIAAEDKRYYHHGAIDVVAIARAVLEAMQAREIVSGASTITMQLARMLHPTPRTLPNKVGEIWTSWRLTAGMNKDEILAAYINRLPMGSNLYGVEAAARTYFGIGAIALNLAQATLLASLPNDPVDLDPYYEWEALKQRQRYVLDRMVEDKLITAIQGERTYREQVILRSRQEGIVAAPHFLFWVAQHLPTPAPAKVRATLDRRLQKFVSTQVEQIVTALAPQRANHAAALVVNNHTGEVLAYVGSPDYFESQEGQNDGVQALRQPGSTLKPFLYQFALEQGIIQPQSILADVPTTYAIPGAKLYRPVDYSETFLGPVRVRLALANSLNIPAVRVLEKVGVPIFLDYLRELGFVHLTYPPEHYGLGLTLGSGEVSLWELTAAYLRLARDGASVPLVTYVGAEPPALVSPNETTSWQLVRDMLGDRHARATAFGVNSVLDLPFPAAVKTGTSSDFRDTWTVGFSKDYTVATWVGNFDGTRMKQVSGVMGAAPLWNRIMQHLHQEREPEGFATPSGLVRHPICAVTGHLVGMEGINLDCPSATVLEYINLEESTADLSAKISDRAISNSELPPEYNEWLAHQPEQQRSGKLRIIFPENNDYFLLSQNALSPDGVGKSPFSPERIQFRVAGSLEEPIEWWLNGEKIGNGTSRSLFWPMEAGSWSLEVRRKNSEVGDRIAFQVREPEEPQSRRGFSIAH
ncbi:penicillin-binding protein 1C [Roseofilum casamattae]|uniref:Penicillin-binding protein 1C n=1 Tax=Roseofilum casamattae BLCC-M143 TaxID=3022442 RepID=A0ABT7C4U0_9CYAN|nr:penicillin-binding protein 1C [Roseofilum casamattae]MDJ1185798.1 penicillin-binding protein 1C [Roseofilum casamattae BLCC-M143]